VEAIQQIGSYAGFAAVVGLAVLSALYFSQARDLRRLREWAGRAPDREASPRSAAEPRGASAAPERQSQVSGAAAGGDALAGQGTAAASARPVEARGRATATALSQPPASQSGTPAPTGPPAPASVGSSAARRSPLRATPNGAPAGPARSVGEPRRSSERSLSLRYVVLAVVGALIVIAAGTFAVGLLDGREESAPPQRANTPGAPRQPAAPGAPSSVTFSVLNGTGVDGLGKQVADELEATGYRRGNVTNASEQKAESVVLYAGGARADAFAVAREIEVSQTEPIDASSQVLAGDASVVVVAGADRAQ
jgi:hypothetical protein